MINNNCKSRRNFLRNIGAISGMLLLYEGQLHANETAKKNSLGLVTYLWGKDWDIDTLIRNLSKTKIHGVELRVDHAHGVSPALSKTKRQEVQKKFADSPVTIIGMGTNQQYDFDDAEKLRLSIEETKDYIRLSHDIGASGVKVKPNQFRKGVPHAKTIEQIGKALNDVAQYGADYGQQIRLEVHGSETQELYNIKAIMDVADHPNATVCWNCNPTDLNGNGLKDNFDMVKSRLGDICHIHELNDTTYPYQDLITLFVKNNYQGWFLLECSTNPEDKIKALVEQRKIFDKMIAIAKKS